MVRWNKLNHDDAAAKLTEHTAAAVNTQLRSWRYDLKSALADDEPCGLFVELEPWIEPTADPLWIARGVTELDLAATFWSDLPDDWRQRFVELASMAAAAVIAALDEGRSPEELDADDAFLDDLARSLRRPWLAPPRVIVDGEVRRGPWMAERALARTAIHVYAGLRMAIGGLGDVPAFPPPDPERDFVALYDGAAPSPDETDASFDLDGEAVDPTVLTALTGLQPRRAWRRGDIRMNAKTGQIYSVCRKGHWCVESRLERFGTKLEDHVVHLLDRLEPYSEALAPLIASDGTTATVRLVYIQLRSNAMWELSAGTLRRITALHASVIYDSYIEDDPEAHNEEDEEDEEETDESPNSW